MKRCTTCTIDGCEAVASVAYRTADVMAIYPITPASAMGELAEAWHAAGKLNIWSVTPEVVEMQSEAGAAGAVHGALQAGSLSTTFTASQGLLLMIPSMYKIAGELTATVFHIATRTVATHALSIFGDHSDIMAARQTGFAILFSNSVQEAQDLALIAQAATLESRVPFAHCFDGFRTSHEVSKVACLRDNELHAMIDDTLVAQHRSRALSPDHPVLRGTAQNPDVFFQAREAANPFYAACPDIVQRAMDRFATLTGRQYQLFEYYGAPDAERVLVLMGSGCETASETVDALNARGERVGVLKVRLYRPFDVKCFIEALPATTRTIAVLDRTKEPGSVGEPLFVDCVVAIDEGLSNSWGTLASRPRIIGGRYGLSSKEFTPAMIAGIFDHMTLAQPKRQFTIGIQDDVTHMSLPYDPDFNIEPEDRFSALFYGLGSDGTVGANKNSIKIIGEHTTYFAQGFFEYDSRKAGAVTISHLRFGPEPIRSAYLVTRANFVGCHQPMFLARYDMLASIRPGGTFLLNTDHGPKDVWDQLPRVVQEHLINKRLKFFVINAYKVANDTRMGRRINTIMQTCFFAISHVIPKDEAIHSIQGAIRATFERKGEEIVQRNLNAVDHTLEHLHEVQVPARVTSTHEMDAPVSADAPPFVRHVLGPAIARQGDTLPVSALPYDGTFPVGSASYEKRNLAQEIPVWDPDVCIQCGKCVIVCPHAVIRMKAYDAARLSSAPATFLACDAQDREFQGQKFTIQVAPEDCTGCTICVDVCPAKSKTDPTHKALNMQSQKPLRETERANWDFFLQLPEVDRRQIKNAMIRQQQFQQPLFEFSGACSGCGETPYIKLMTQLYGDRLMVANATGCSSIFGGNLPTTPWTANAEGRGPAWSNSLFEDNAEFGLGFRLSLDQQRARAEVLLTQLASDIGEELATAILTATQRDEADIYEQRERITVLKKKLQQRNTAPAQQLLALADMLAKKTVWIVGGDGWAYDIGFGGLDHVLASGHDVNVLVLDTEVYSNTGGQMSKATPLAAVAKFASGGKRAAKKDLGLIAMTYGNIYVASVMLGARDEHTLRVFLEAEAYQGPSLILAYSHCIAHGVDMGAGMQHQKAAVDAGQWLLYRFHPDRIAEGENPLRLDCPAPKLRVENYLKMENRFRMLVKNQPEQATQLFQDVQAYVDGRRRLYEYIAAWKPAPAPAPQPTHT